MVKTRESNYVVYFSDFELFLTQNSSYNGLNFEDDKKCTSICQLYQIGDLKRDISF